MEKGDCIYAGSHCYRLITEPKKNGRKDFATWSVTAVRESNGKKYFLKYTERQDKAAVEILKREGKFRMYYAFIEHVYGACRGTDNEGKPLYIVVAEHIEGMDLKEYVNCRTMEEECMFRYMMQFLRGVRYYIHFEKKDPFVHRDLKPDNIMVSDRLNKIFISDFDWAHISGSVKTQYGKFCVGGTKGYMDPRAGRTNKTDIKMDIYSMGRIFCFWMIGKDYFNDIELDEYFEPENEELAYSLYMDRFPKKYHEKKYSKLIQIIRKMVAPEFGRYENITEILSDMTKFLKEYYGEGKEFLKLFFERNLLECPEERLAEDIEGISYKIVKNGEEQGGRISISLENYRMHDIEVEREPVMSIYNLDREIYYIPYRKNLKFKTENERFMIEGSMTFQYGDFTISFFRG